MFKLTPFNTSPRKRSDMMDFSDMIDDFFASPFRSLRHDTFKIDVEEEDNAYLVKADLPGVQREDIKVSYEDQVMNIEVKHDENKEEEDKEKNYIHRERRVCSMRRAIHLPDIDPDKIKAKLENGVLNIRAEKSEIQDRGYVVDVE